MNSEIAGDKQYKKWLVEMKDRIRGAQIRAVISVSKELLNLYWELGKDILGKKALAKWGDGLIDQLSKDLSSAFPGNKGFSKRNLFYIKRWYSLYKEADPIVQQLVAQIPWGHNIDILTKTSSIEEATFYVRGTRCHRPIWRGTH
ncbi:DUF1016 N-terminal domain-containing protein [Dinghuibacter silviterrae]|uniref:DUF1016 N-terminal domain-containing protein n=1 Tax=Dinghuibacter silviterrae TaxID=1539049 RepID=UPI001B85F89C|nr:DUF1016 N-terminal domain-containing protein [Dinghuibacter silviterrae]